MARSLWLALSCSLYRQCSFPKSWSFLKKDFIIYFLVGKGGRKRGRETSMCGCLSHAPYRGPGPQPRHVPWLGIELTTLWLAGWHTIHWATPARARSFSLTQIWSFLRVIILTFVSAVVSGLHLSYSYSIYPCRSDTSSLKTSTHIWRSNLHCVWYIMWHNAKCWFMLLLKLHC